MYRVIQKSLTRRAAWHRDAESTEIAKARRESPMTFRPVINYDPVGANNPLRGG